MSISVFKTFSSGEVLTASDLNSSFTQIVNNAADMLSPLTKAITMNGFALGFDPTSTVTLTASTGLNLAGAAFNTPQGSDIASATTISLDAATGNLVDVTGTTTITTITLAQGRWRWVRFTGALILTHGANLVLPGAVSITTSAGCYALFVGYASSVVRCAFYNGNGIFTTPTLVNPTITNYIETVFDLGTGTAFSPVYTNGTKQKLTTSGNTTITLPTPVAGKAMTIYVTYGGGHSITFAGGGTLKYTNGVAPTATSINTKIDIYLIDSVDTTNTFVEDRGRAH